MEEICCPIPTTESLLKNRAKDNCKDGKNNAIKFLFEVFLALTYAYLRTQCESFRKIYISEMHSFSNDISFPFQELLIIIKSKFEIRVETMISYNNVVINSSEKIINITDEFKKKNVSNLILNKEYNDFIAIFFKINGTLNDRECGQISIYYKMFVLNNTDNNIEVDTLYKPLHFEIYNELASYQDNKKFKTYLYNVHSYSIQALNETYNFPMIDEHEKYRYFYDVPNFYNFGVYLSKKNYLNTLKVTTDSFKEIAFISFGSIGIIFELIFPFILLLKDIIKFYCCKFEKKKPLKENEINVGNKNLELSEVNV